MAVAECIIESRLLKIKVAILKSQMKLRMELIKCVDVSCVVLIVCI